MQLFEALFSAGSFVGAPALGNPITLSSAPGDCVAPTDATLNVIWGGISNPDDVNYEVHVLENGVLVSTQATTTGSYVKTIVGYVEGGAFSPFTSNWTYTVQIVRKLDGVVIGSRVSSVWTKTYGKCTRV